MKIKLPKEKDTRIVKQKKPNQLKNKRLGLN